MIRVTDTDKPSLHLVYDMWDTTIEKDKSVNYRHEEKRENEHSPFYDVVHQILEDRWNKSTSMFGTLFETKIISKLMNYFIVINVVIL